eukprot:scaffold135270_cov181-Phaeocystis_antarctica.AAC.1
MRVRNRTEDDSERQRQQFVAPPGVRGPRPRGGHAHRSEKIRALTYGMCRYAALVHGALRARDGVDSLRQCALQRPSNAFSSCASAMGLPPSPAGMAWRRPKN